MNAKNDAASCKEQLQKYKHFLKWCCGSLAKEYCVPGFKRCWDLGKDALIKEGAELLVDLLLMNQINENTQRQ